MMDTLSLACAVERTLSQFLDDDQALKAWDVDVLEHAQDDNVPEIRIVIEGIEFRATIERVA
jgi:hypothetical protein